MAGLLARDSIPQLPKRAAVAPQRTVRVQMAGADLLTGWAHHKSLCFSVTRARDRVLLTRCGRSQIFTKIYTSCHCALGSAGPTHLHHVLSTGTRTSQLGGVDGGRGQ